MSNPFFFDDPAPADNIEEGGNPFLIETSYNAPSSAYTGINPFSSIPDTAVDVSNIFGANATDFAPNINPFGDINLFSSQYDSHVTPDVVPSIDLFGTAPMQEEQSTYILPSLPSSKAVPPRPPSPSIFAASPDKEHATGRPPPRPPSPSTFNASPDAEFGSGHPMPSRPPPPSKETKDLLDSVIGAIDATSYKLQDKLDCTKTPCPSPANGAHSPRSPTPDIQVTAPEAGADAFSNIFGRTIELSDQDFDDSEVVNSHIEEQNNNEEVDLFGEPISHSKPKTTQDILSLYNKPEETGQLLDLLSDDLSKEQIETHENDVKGESTDVQSTFPTSSQGETLETHMELSSLDNQNESSEISKVDNTREIIICDHSDLAVINQESEVPKDTEETSPVTLPDRDQSEPEKIRPSPVASPTGPGMTIEDEVEKVSYEQDLPETVATPISGIPDETQVAADDVNQPTSICDTTIGDTSLERADALQSTIFGDIPVENSLSSTTEGSYTDTTAPIPVEASTGFSIFAGEEVPSGAESVGATLFETTAPAPNVGMSLFGGGYEASLDIFAESDSNVMVNPFAPTPSASDAFAALGPTAARGTKLATEEEFDAFSARFENVGEVEKTTDQKADSFAAASPWGDTTSGGSKSDALGFGESDQFDAFLALSEPPPAPVPVTPRRAKKVVSQDSDEIPMNVVIRPSGFGSTGPDAFSQVQVPILAPPPVAVTAAFSDATPRFNPFDKSAEETPEGVTVYPMGKMERTDSQETPPTPLFEEDQSMPLEPFPRTAYVPKVWEMYLRSPNKKKLTGQRFWKKVFVKITETGGLQLFNNIDDKEPLQDLPLQPCYSVSDIGAQQFDQFGKIFTVKVQYMYYKERPGVRPGQISKAERLTNKLSKFAQYAIAGDYEGVKEFASDVRKLGMPVEHAPQISQLVKLGSSSYEDLKVFASILEEFMFKIPSQRERTLTYKMEEVQLTAVDEMYVEHDQRGIVTRMIARVRIFFLSFISGMADIDLGVNDLKKQGCEVVGRHDIIPVVTEEWIRLEDIEFHSVVDKEEFEKTRHIKFKPPDACYIELMRFRVRPPRNRELPLQVKSKVIIEGKRIDIVSEILVPGFSGRKLGQVPCEDVALRFPLPESWIYMFRVEKHFRYGSVKSAHRRTGKVKGIERFMGAVETAETALMEVTSGQAKYEHQHRAIVWRISRLPKEGQGAYTVHQFTCRINLTGYDQIPESLDRYCVLEFTMPATTVSHCVMRSVSVKSTSDEPPEKYVRYLARQEYKIEMEFTSGSGPNQYIAATMKDGSNIPKQEPKPLPPPVEEESSSDDS